MWETTRVSSFTGRRLQTSVLISLTHRYFQDKTSHQPHLRLLRRDMDTLTVHTVSPCSPGHLQHIPKPLQPLEINYMEMMKLNEFSCVSLLFRGVGGGGWGTEQGGAGRSARYLEAVCASPQQNRDHEEVQALPHGCKSHS